MASPSTRCAIRLWVNDQEVEWTVEARQSLADFLREELNLTGTHLGCEHGVCGACTVLLDGDAVRSCLLLAAQCHGAHVTTVEGLAPGEHLHPLQTIFQEAHGLQCGFCTPGMLLTALAFLRETPHPSEAQVRQALAGNLCRCTGYQSIIEAVLRAAQQGEEL
jgi:carbon-monoxide dehydrogenase small subunit